MTRWSERTRRLFAERERRKRAAEEDAKKKAAEAEAQAIRWTLIAEQLREDYHPKQRAFCRSKAKRRAAKCTRRAGKTRGGCRETLARALERRIRVLYCAATRDEAKDRAWRSDTRDGWRDLLDKAGLRIARTRAEFEKGLADVLVNETELTIDFRNGSQLAIFAADRPEDADKLRGGEKDIIWIDEAQIFPALTYFVEQVVAAMLKKPGGDQGELWLTGTPSTSLAGLFYEATKEPEQGERLRDATGQPAYEVHEFAVIDNPYYGATAEERWDATAGQELKDNGWDPNDPPPQFVREWLGKWTTADALFVYLVHKFKPHEFARPRVDEETGILDFAAAVRDLPEWIEDENGRPEAIVWYFALGVDFGGDPDPFAWVLWAFSPQIADLYEMGSWKKTNLVPDAMKAILWSLWAQAGHAMVSIRGDSSGALGKPTLVGWQESTGMPIEPADRHGKATWIQLYNGELAGRHVHYRTGSHLLVEHQHLQWRLNKAGKREEWADRRIKDPRGQEWVPGNHCCFVAGTMVETVRGPTPIESLRAGDLVWTRAGLRPVIKAAPTGWRETWRMETEAGRIVVGTGDHPILVDSAWVALSDLTRDCVVTAWASTDRPSASPSAASCIDATRNRSIAPSGSTSPPSEAIVSTAPSGRPSTDLSRPGTTSTTRTRTRSTTPSTTWSFARLARTCAGTWATNAARLWRVARSLASAISRQRGIAPTPAAHGTASTASAWPPSDRSTSEPVRCAARPSGPSTPPLADARAPATRRPGAPPAPTTPTSPAASAAAPSGGTGTNSAPATVGDRVRRVRPTGLVEQVYALSVDGQPEYFAGGVLVSNCDAGLYSYRDLIQRRKEFDRDELTEEEKLKRLEARILASMERASRDQEVYAEDPW